MSGNRGHCTPGSLLPTRNSFYVSAAEPHISIYGPFEAPLDFLAGQIFSPGQLHFFANTKFLNPAERRTKIPAALFPEAF